MTTRPKYFATTRVTSVPAVVGAAEQHLRISLSRPSMPWAQAAGAALIS